VALRRRYPAGRVESAEVRSREVLGEKREVFGAKEDEDAVRLRGVVTVYRALKEAVVSAIGVALPSVIHTPSP
jgi:hypothetical protein